MTTSENKTAIFTRLKHSLQLLAIPAEQQLDLLPDFVLKGDELALEFDHWYIVSIGNYGEEFTAAQKEAMKAIIELLDKMSGQKNSELWTERAIQEDEKWGQIRLLAKKALDEFGWSVKTPPSYGHEYIPGRRS
jgi:hypothetical protein